jgi:hypothetical protein
MHKDQSLVLDLYKLHIIGNIPSPIIRKFIDDRGEYHDNPRNLKQHRFKEFLLIVNFRYF